MTVTMSDLYTSRTERTAAIVSRQEPVVYPDPVGSQPLNKSQLREYEDNGFLLLPDLFNAQEVQALLGNVEAMSTDPGILSREEAVVEKDSQAVRSIFRVHELSELIARLVRDPRVLDVARQILGSEVYVHQSRANLKPGFTGKEFYWHSDFETWHIEDGMPQMRALSCSVLLTDNNVCNGPLMLVPGSHRQFISCTGQTPDNHYKESLRKQEYGVPDPISLRLLVDQGGIEAITAKAGSVIFFDCNTLHGSASNISPWPRANVFTVYNSVENCVGDPKQGLTPRPAHVATRGQFPILTPLNGPLLES